MPATPTFAADVIQSLTAELACRVPAAYPPCRGLILTGSAARKEATIARRPEGILWLSDLELLVVVSDSTDFKQANRSLDSLAAEISRDLRLQGVQLELELTPAPERYFRRIRPHLFGYELKTCGRQIFGLHDYLGRIPAFDWRSIPAEEAFRLVSNRIMEWIEYRLEAPRLDLARQFYVLAKTYLDLLTALSLLSDTYAPSYRARFENKDRAIALARMSGCSLPASFSRSLEIAFDFKFDPESRFRYLWDGDGHDLVPALETSGLRFVHDDLPFAALGVWWWALSRISPGRVLALNRPPRIHSCAARLRGWARLLLHAGSTNRLSLLARAARLFPAGSPRTLAYACVARLADPVHGHSEQALDWVRRYLPAGVPVPNAGWQDLAGACLAFWRRHLRRSHA